MTRHESAVARSRRSTAAPVDGLRASDPTLARLIESLEPVDLATWRARWSLDPFSSLARAIVGQQIATRAAAAIFGRLQAFIRDRDPARLSRVQPTSSFARSGCPATRRPRCAISPARTLDGRLALDRLEDLSDEEAHEQLTAVRGIGSWTADMFLLGQLGRPDILPAGDLGIRRAVQQAYDLEKMPSEGEVRRISEAWRPNRSLATAYLYSSLRSLVPEPRRRPR